MFSSQRLAQLLELEQEKKTEKFTHEVSYQNRGPGRFDAWRYVFANDENSFVSRKSNIVSNKKKKIIFSNFFLTEAPLSESEIPFIASLMENYEVYFWPGKNTPFTKAKRISDSIEFWDKLPSCQPASQQEVEEHLAQQGIAAQDFIIMDYERYKKIANKINAVPEFFYEILDLTTVALEIPKIRHLLKQSIDLKHVKEIEIYAGSKEALEFIANEFANLSKIYVKHANVAWLMDFSEVFKNKKNIELQVISGLENISGSDLTGFEVDRNMTLHLKSATHIKTVGEAKALKLVLEQGQSDVKFESDTLSDVTLHMSDQRDLSEVRIDLSGSPMLQDLTVTNYLNRKEVDIVCENPRKLYLRNLKLSKLNIDKFSELQIFWGQNVRFASTHLNLTKNKKLEVLRLEKSDLTTIDIKGMSHLVNISLQDLDALKIVDIAGNDEIFSIKIANCPLLQSIPFSQFSKLRMLVMEEVRNINFNDLARCQELNQLMVKGCGFSGDFPYSKLINLTHLSVENESQLFYLNLLASQNLTKLEIVNCPLTMLNLPKNLLELDLQACPAIHRINFDACKQLRKVTIKKICFLNAISFPKGLLLETFEMASELSPTIFFENCKNLKKVYLSASNARESGRLDFSQLENLEDLTLLVESVHELKLTGCKNLKRLVIHANLLHKIDFSELPSLEELEIVGNLKEIDLSSCPQIKYLYIRDNGSLEKLTFAAGSQLQTFKIKDCRKIDYLPLRNCAILKNLHIENCPQFRDLFLPENPKLESLTSLGETSCIFSMSLREMKYLKSVTFTDAMFADLMTLPQISSLSHLNITNFDGMDHFDFSGMPLLKSLTISGRYKEIDLHHCHQLNYLNYEYIGREQCEVNVEGCENLRVIEANVRNVVTFKNIESCQQLLQAKLQSYNIEQVLLTNVFPEYCIVTQWRFVPPEYSYANTEVVSAVPTPKRFTPDQYVIHQQNARNPVSIFSMRSHLEVDADTARTDVPHNATGGFVSALESSTFIDATKYRINILDEIISPGKGDIRFVAGNRNSQYQKLAIKSPIPVFTDKDIQSYKHTVKHNPGLGLGYFKGELLKDRFYPLVTDQALNMTDLAYANVFCKPANAIQIFWNEALQQFAVKLNPAFNSGQEVEVVFLYKYNASYEQQPKSPPLVEKAKKLLPDVVHSAIANLIKSTPSLSFMISDFPIEQKLKSIIQYCSSPSFTDTALELKTKTPLDKLLAVIGERKGACRHRAQAFMTLARYLNIPARIIVNEQHAFCEYPTLNENKEIQWHRADMGGSETLDLTPLEKRNAHNVFKKVAPKKPSMAAAAAATVNEDAEKIKGNAEFINQYQQEFMKLVTEDEVKTLDDIFKNTNPLIKLTEYQDPFHVHASIFHAIQSSNVKTNFLYINSPADFIEYLKPFKLENGERKQIDGPLFDLINSGGVIVVNWSNFSATEMASYKSIVDKVPTLLGHSMSNQVRVIGLVKDNIETAFRSRCKPMTLHNSFFATTSKPVEPIQNINEPVTIDLFHRQDWRDHLLGKVIFKGDQIILEEGLLIKAMRNQQPVTIYNPPEDDKEFDLLLKRLRLGSDVLFNGEKISVPAGFSIDINHVSHPTEIANVKVHLDNEAVKGKKPIYLGLYNLHECYEMLEIQASKANLLDGYIKSFNDASHYFYLIESIPLSDWQALLDHIATIGGNKNFDFVLAPGVMIGDLIENNKTLKKNIVAIDEVNKITTSVLVSNDADYLSSQLQKQDPDNTIVIHVSPETSFNDLIATMKINKQSDSSKVEFDYQELGVMKALQEGKKVILNGEMSPALYQQLLPILYGTPPQIYINGHQMELSGKLIAVVSEKAANKLPLMQYDQCDYSLKDYEKIFANDAAHFNAISQFYFFANQISQSAMGRPEKIELSQKRIERMIFALKNHLIHPHNPIKGIFHFDYPRQSRDYAYLNVMAKYLFSENDDTPHREDKLQRLLTHLNIQNKADMNEHAWSILNCFRGAILRKIFAPGLDETINLSFSFPSLQPQALDTLWAIVQPYLNKKVKPALPKDKVQLRTEKLRKLLEDKATPLIILKGEPGVGKTYAMRHLKSELDFDTYEGEDGILKWLEAKSAHPMVLLLDEANLETPGTWDFLKGLSSEKRSVFYKGKEYALTDQHKIIATGNPETYPGRSYHALFQHYGETLMFDMPDDDYLEKIVIGKTLTSDKFDASVVSKHLLYAYHLIQKFNPTFVYSNRDLESLTQRFLVIFDSGVSIDEAIAKAGEGEFAGTIHDPVVRNTFVSSLYSYFDLSKETEKPSEKMLAINDSVFIPQEKAYLKEVLTQNLAMRENAISKKDDTVSYKLGVLIEGDPGLGKSTLLKALLEKQGMTKDNADPQKRYYEVSVGESKTVHDILLKAWREGSVVILDELNLDESLEKLLNQLLTGTNEQGEKPDKPGFAIFSSQNPSNMAGRKSVSHALRNRLHVLYMEPFSDVALQGIAKHQNVPHPVEFVQGFKSCGKAVNMRTFYQLAERVGVKQVANLSLRT